MPYSTRRCKLSERLSARSFAAVTTELPGKRALVITTGELSSAISASCADRFALQAA